MCRTGKRQGQQRGGHSTSAKTRVRGMIGDLIDWTGHKHFKALMSLKCWLHFFFLKKRTGFYYVVLAGLVLAMKSRLVLRTACLSLPSAGTVWFWLFWDRFHEAQAGRKLIIQPKKIINLPSTPVTGAHYHIQCGNVQCECPEINSSPPYLYDFNKKECFLKQAFKILNVCKPREKKGNKTHIYIN